MTRVLALGYIFSCIAAALAWKLARRNKDHLPIAYLLTFALASDLVRRALRVFVFEPAYPTLAGGPATGWLRAAAHLEAALFIAWPAALAATALAIFLNRRPWPVAIAWVLAAVGLAASYPLTRGDVLRQCYLAAELSGLAVAVGALLHWITFRRETPSFKHLAMFLIMSVNVTGLISGPWRWNIFDNWSFAQVSYAALYALLIATQGAVLWTTSKPTSE